MTSTPPTNSNVQKNGVKQKAQFNKSPKANDMTTLALKALMVRNRQDLQELIQQQVSNIILFDNMSINIVDDQALTYSFYAYYSREAMKVDDEFTRFKSATFAVADGFFDVTLETDFPVIWDLNEVITWSRVPDCVAYCHANNIKVVVGVSIISKDKRIGNVFFGFAQLSNFNELDIKYIHEVATHISVAVGTIKFLEDNVKLHRQKDMLLSLSNAIATVKDRATFNYMLTSVLKKLIKFNGVVIYLTGQEKYNTNPYLSFFDDEQKPSDREVTQGDVDIIKQRDIDSHQILETNEVAAWSISELMKLDNRPEFITRFRTNQVRKVAYLPISNNNHKVAHLFLFSENTASFGPEDVRLISEISPQISTAVFNMLNYDTIAKKEKESRTLISLIKCLVLIRERKQFEEALKSEFRNMDFFDEAVIYFLKPGQQACEPLYVKKSVDPALRDLIKLDENTVLEEQDVFCQKIKYLKEATEFSINDLLKLENVPAYVETWATNGIVRIAAAPIYNVNQSMGTLILFSKRVTSDFYQHLGLINGIASQISAVAAGLIANERIAKQLDEISSYKQQLEIENLYLQEEIQTTHNYSEIVGTSKPMRELFHLVSQVSTTNSSVLILGETGTGKELIARAIHNTSSRRDKVMVKVNCATLPANLIESELFGHERGSFTGATERRIGKFELANNSTIFLDEIGEMPPGLQVKLLRALQEKEIERIGGKVTIKTDVRVIAATNRDLFKEVQSGNFRSDLYFRLNVFPIILPALRNRKEDVPLLAAHFVEKYAKKLNVSLPHITSRAMKQLVAYNWPGNVRELEHLIERSVLLARGSAISQVYLPGVNGDEMVTPLQNTDVKTIDEIEREHIISVLKMVNGKVSGVGGAAEILKIPATTLSSKILRLKIKKGVL